MRHWLANTLSRASSWLRGKSVRRASFPFVRFLLGGSTGWPGSWHSDRFEQVRHYRHWVYIGARAIANEIARANPQVGMVEPVSTGERASARSLALAHKAVGRRKNLAGHEEITPVGPEHPVARLMADPNDPQTRREFWFAWAVNYKIFGQAFVWARPSGIVLDGRKLIADLWCLPTHWVFPVPGKDQPIEFYEIRPYGGIGAGAGGLRIPYEDVIPFTDYNPMFPLTGYSPLEAGSEWVDVAESQHSAQWSQMKRGLHPGLVLELGEEENITDEMLDRYYAKLEERLRGEYNFNAPLIVGHGANLKPMTMLTAQEMAFIESGDQSRDRILALMGVPKGVVGIEPGADNISAYAPLRAFCRFTISPILDGLGETLTERLARRYDKRLRIWYDDPTPNDPQEVRAEIETRLKGQAISPNEIRALFGVEPWDPALFADGDLPVKLKPSNGQEEEEATSRLAASLARLLAQKR